MFRVYNIGFRVSSLGFRVQGRVLKVQSLERRVLLFTGFRVGGLR